MAKKDATDHKQKGKPATAKSPEKAKREATPAKSPKPPKNKKKTKEPLNREERKKVAWLRKTERKVARQTVTEVGDKASAGLTFDQLKASGLMAKPSQPPAAAGPTLEQILLEVVAEQARQFEESAEPAVSLPATPDPEVCVFPDGMRWSLSWYETSEEPLSSIATRKVVVAEICSLLEKTGLIFNAYREPSILATPSVAVEDAFEKEPKDSPLKLRLAGVILADDPMAAIENLLEETWGQVVKLQLIASALEPEDELEKSARLGLVDEVTADRLKKAAVKEAIRIDLAQRLAGLTASTGAPAEVDEAFATLIAEAAQAAEAQRRKRAAFRQTLREKREDHRRRSSKSSEKPDDEEFLFFLISHRGESGVEQALLARQIEVETTAAEKHWADLKSRLAAGANYPETAVAQNVTAMKNLLGAIAQLRALHVQLLELDDTAENRGAEGASWINQLNPLSKRRSRGPRGMRHLLQQVQPLRPGKETADKEDLARFLGRRGGTKITPFAASLKTALA